MLRLIATFKFLKVALLIATGVGIFKLLHKGLAGALEHWITLLGLSAGNQFVEAALAKAATLTPQGETSGRWQLCLCGMISDRGRRPLATPVVGASGLL